MSVCPSRISSAAPSSAPCAKPSGDKLAAARLLGIGKTTLYRKFKQYEGQSPAESPASGERPN